MIKRETIIKEAREWLGTPFVHQGRQKGVGCDCAGIVIGISKLLGLKLEDIVNYSRTPNAEKLKKHLNKELIRIKKEDAIPGDILLFKIRNNPQHIAIMTDIGMLHAYSIKGVEKIVEHGITDRWKSRLHQAYRLPGVE